MKDMTFPLVYIIIVNWNKPDDTCDCLETVLGLEYPNYKTIVVDNGSTDDSVSIIRKKFSNITMVVNDNNIGYTGGNNIGIDIALENNADYVWILNNDTIIAKDSLTLLVDKLEKDDKYGLASPLIYYYGDNSVQFCGSYLDAKSNTIVKIDDINDYKLLKNVYTIILWGTALLIKVSVIKNIGKLNNKYFAYHEDCEYCIRAERAGYKAFVVPKALIYHKDSLSTGGKRSPIQSYLRIRNLYFLWNDNMKYKDRLYNLREYMSFVISQAAQLYLQSEHEAAEACLSGAWNAYKNNGGHWQNALPTPKIIRSAFIFILNHHPFFWSKIISGKYQEVILESWNRITRNYYKRVE